MIKPFALHPENSRYFIFRDKPTVLITSGEHYGAVLNGDFNYDVYLQELHAHGLNHTRLFSGVYHEVPGSFGIKNNVLAPAADRYISPWPRTNVPGAFDGGTKYDLDQWNEVYFTRLKDFCAKASQLGVVIEINLFCPFYTEELWDICPLNHRNNINGVGRVPSNEVYTCKHPDLLFYQDALTQKIVEELNGFDNIYYEVCNEPWVNGVTMEWQHYIAETIVDTEERLENRHLISINVCNGHQRVENPHPAFSIFNFHYASPPIAALENYHLNKAIGLNETGFAGQDDYTYRRQAWEFIMAGGALYNNLDYSFAVGYEDGTYQAEGQPGGGSRALRKQLGILKDFIESLDFIHMIPDNSIVKKLHTLNGTGYMLAQHGKAYAMYIGGHGEADLLIDIPVGEYDVEWIEPVTGKTVSKERVSHPGGLMRAAYFGYKEDIALKIIRV